MYFHDKNSPKKIKFIYFSMNLQVPSDRVGLGRPRARPGRAKSDDLALDPMRAGPDTKILALTLALLGSGRADPRANRARPCPWTVYVGSAELPSRSYCHME